MGAILAALKRGWPSLLSPLANHYSSREPLVPLIYVEFRLLGTFSRTIFRAIVDHQGY